VYFLRKEVAAASLTSLSSAVSLLLDLEGSLKLGGKGDSMLPAILAIAQLFPRELLPTLMLRIQRRLL